MTRPHGSSAYNALTTAFKAVIDDVGGLDAMATVTRVRRSALSDYANRHLPDKFAPIDVVLDGEAIAQVPHVTATLARLQGYELIRVDVRGAGELAGELARIGRDCGDLFEQACSLLSGDQVSEQQREKMIADLDDMARAAREASAMLSRKDQA